MAYESVVVHSVDLLENFWDVLQQQHDELEVVYDTLNSECTLQGENWNDPQYTYLKECIDEYYQLSKTQLAQLEDSTAYITSLIEKLRAI
mgnify:CR=1 FL=1